VSSYLNNNIKQQKSWGVAQVAECLPSKCDAVGSIPKTVNINKQIDK
jgi:hypothetical protein